MNKRVQTIDGLRGFSLVGILIANLLIFQYGMFGKDKMENFHLSTMDEVAYVWTKIFIESSFIPIFMFLFGYSMVLLRNKLERNGKKVKRHFIRRFLLLMVFGLLHATFIWEGDILLTYGLMGFVMLIFLNRKKKTILIWAILLFVITSLFSFGDTEETEEMLAHQESYIEKESHAYSEGTYKEAYEFRNSAEDPFGLPDDAYVIMLVLTPFITSPMFLFGMYAAKRNWFRKPEKEEKMYIRYAIICIPIGLVFKSILYLFPDFSIGTALYSFGATFLAIGYIFAFSYLYTKYEIKILSAFEKVGKLSMTNYLLQSVICTVIFYGYGFGLFGKLGVFYGILLGIVVYACQVIISHYYLKIWKMGPFEKVMRIGTYLSWKGKPNQKKQIDKKKFA